ncbi:DNA repair protein RadA [Rhodocaloribacter litoris]|uniref:DNA repair protein RadA n=1 Tax=Rhodocaloribacter litoris TaxID=2558931 RepID=UPI001423FDD7|nr:DNA repair protein RadA [Rhodocaloribacter litoris]QXD16530.1 DNA repair protein RadA [Rhodocaloribacter litoris]
MPRSQTRYVCQACGHAAPRWLGKCPSCEAWNTFVEEVAPSPVKARVARVPGPATEPDRPLPLSEVALGEETRLRTGVEEFDRVMGGGIMHGSVTLLAGDPGIGKSTLMTELGKYLPQRRLLYVTGEESPRQVKLRARRLGVETDALLLLAETNVEAIVAAARETAPDLLVVDSIQTLFRPDIESAPGSVSQVRESAAALIQLAKRMDLPAFLVGHVTKEGAIAGPRVLEHMVDTVLYLEGDRHHAYRILRAVKNRFGSTNEIGVFEMRETGLAEVHNPSEIFLSQRTYGVSGSTVVCALEGTRPVLVEIQALVAPTSYPSPQRTATGFDNRRLQMLLAVLEKREGLRLSTHDVFLNVAGGVRLSEPAVDLGVVVAVASSFRDIPADTGTVLIGEVGLGGELRTVSRIEPRLKEAARLGFERAVVPKHNLKGLRAPKGLVVTGAERLHAVLELVL